MPGANSRPPRRRAEGGDDEPPPSSVEPRKAARPRPRAVAARSVAPDEQARIKARIDAIVERHDGNEKEAALAIGISQQAVNGIRRGVQRIGPHVARAVDAHDGFVVAPAFAQAAMRGAWPAAIVALVRADALAHGDDGLTVADWIAYLDEVERTLRDLGRAYRSKRLAPR